MPVHESLHFLQGNGAIVVGIHCLEYALVRRLKLLQSEFPVTVSIHQTENYSHHHGMAHHSVAVAHHSAAHHSAVMPVLVLMLHHRTTWYRCAGTLGTRSNNATGEDSRSCRE
jgi:hypothetical protein